MNEQQYVQKEDCNRPGFEQVYMEFAFSIAKRATCKRLQVGTLLIL